MRGWAHLWNSGSTLSLHRVLRGLLRFGVLVAACAVAAGANIQVIIRVSPTGAQTGPIRLTLSSAAGGDTYQMKTLQSERTYSFPNVRSGHYTLQVESPGFRTVTTEVNVTSYNRMDHSMVVVNLDPLPDESTEARQVEGGETVSVDELAVPPRALKEMERAEDAAARGQSKQAVEHLQKAIREFPGFFQAYNNLAVEYTKLGRLEDAARALEKSIELQPGDATTHRNLAQLYLSFGRHAEAFEQVHLSLEVEPESSKSYLLLANLYLENGAVEAALQCFQEASRLDPADHSRLGIGECLARLGRYTEALAEFAAFLSEAPDDPRAAGVREAVSRLEGLIQGERP